MKRRQNDAQTNSMTTEKDLIAVPYRKKHMEQLKYQKYLKQPPHASIEWWV